MQWTQGTPPAYETRPRAVSLRFIILWAACHFDGISVNASLPSGHFRNGRHEGKVSRSSDNTVTYMFRIHPLLFSLSPHPRLSCSFSGCGFDVSDLKQYHWNYITVWLKSCIKSVDITPPPPLQIKSHPSLSVLIFFFTFFFFIFLSSENSFPVTTASVFSHLDAGFIVHASRQRVPCWRRGCWLPWVRGDADNKQKAGH